MRKKQCIHHVYMTDLKLAHSTYSNLHASLAVMLWRAGGRWSLQAAVVKHLTPKKGIFLGEAPQDLFVETASKCKHQFQACSVSGALASTGKVMPSITDATSFLTDNSTLQLTVNIHPSFWSIKINRSGLFSLNVLVFCTKTNLCVPFSAQV